MARKVQVLIELDPATKKVTTTGPTSHPEVMVKMLGAALAQIADKMAEERIEAESGGPPKPDIIIPKIGIARS